MPGANHTYVVRGHVCDQCIADSIRSWINNPGLDFTESDGIFLAAYLDIAAKVAA